MTKESKSSIWGIFGIEQLVFVSLGSWNIIEKTTVCETVRWSEHECHLEGKRLPNAIRTGVFKVYTTQTFFKVSNSLTMFNSMDIDLDAVIMENTLVLLNMRQLISKLQSLPPHRWLSSDRMLALMN